MRRALSVDNRCPFAASQGADGMRGMKGNKGGKVRKWRRLAEYESGCVSKENLSFYYSYYGSKESEQIDDDDDDDDNDDDGGGHANVNDNLDDTLQNSYFLPIWLC